MTQPLTATRGCRYPGCKRPAVPAEDGVGRPPEYCEDPGHTRASAWRARHAEQAAAAGRSAQEDLGRPVTMAKMRAETIAAQVGSQVAALTTALGQVVDELRTLGDPDAAAAQIDTVTTEAGQRVAESAAKAARAEQDRGVAEQQRDEADAAAAEAVQQLEVVTGQLAELQAAHQTIAEELAHARAARDALAVEVDTERQRATSAEQAAADRQSESTRLAGELDRAASELDQARTAAQSALDRAADLRAQHAGLRAELAAAVQRYEDERAHTETRLADQRANYDTRIAELRQELGRSTPAQQ